MESLALFIPALHQGYIDLISKYDRIYIFDDSVLKETSRFKYLERDLRRILDPKKTKEMLDSLWPEKEVKVINKDSIKNIKEQVHMPLDELSGEIDRRFFDNGKVIFTPIFLRWNKKITTTESEPVPGRTISKDEFDQEVIGKAAELTKKSSDWWRQIGAVIIKDGEVIVEAYNKRLPTEYTQDAYGDPRSNFDAGESIELASTIHAENYAIAQAAKDGIALDGTSMYVTTYPCPVCAKSIAMSGIKKLFYRDGYSLFDAEKILNAFDVEIIQVEET